MQRRDIAMLGALGFTPGQVVWALLVEQTALGVAASALGLAVAWTAIRTPAFIGPPDGVPVALAPLPAPWMALAAAVTVAVGPFLCLAMIRSASPARGDSRS